MAENLAASQEEMRRKERMERELEIAYEMQQSFLPQTLPEVPDVEIAATMHPAREVGGDFYDVIPLSGGRVGVLVADVSDKGVPAALYMALARTLLRAHSGAARRGRSRPRDGIGPGSRGGHRSKGNCLRRPGAAVRRSHPPGDALPATT